MQRAFIDAYADGAGRLGAAIRGLSPADFAAFPIPGTWSIGQIVLHLMDSDLIGADRMKRVIAEDNPSLIGFDESAFAKSLFYERQDPFRAAEIFRMNREFTAIILHQLPDAAFDRAGIHNERGRLTLAELVRGFNHHLHHHLGFIERKRQLLGKAL